MKRLNLFLSAMVLFSTVTPAFSAQVVRNQLVLSPELTPINGYHGVSNNIQLDVKQYPLIGKSKKKAAKANRKQKSRAFYPLEIALSNNSGNELYVSPEMFDIKIMDCAIVAKKMHTSPVVRNTLIAAGLVPGMLFVGISLSANSMLWGALWASAMGLPLGILVAAIGAPAGMIYNNYEYQCNKQALKAEVLHDMQVINPGKTLKKIIFVNELALGNTFNVTLEDAQDTTIPFDVHLTSTTN